MQRLPLARELLAGVATRTKSKATSFTPAVIDQLQRYAWPGNVRELENALERAAVMARGTRIDVGDLPAEIAGAVASSWVSGDERSLKQVEKDYTLEIAADALPQARRVRRYRQVVGTIGPKGA